MDSALLRNLITGAESTSQSIGGLIIALLYGVIGLLSAIGSVLIFRRMFRGRWEQIFWASFLVVIAGFYLSFAAYFEVSTDAWHTELAGVALFLICAVAGLFSRPILATGYVLHGLYIAQPVHPYRVAAMSRETYDFLGEIAALAFIALLVWLLSQV